MVIFWGGVADLSPKQHVPETIRRHRWYGSKLLVKPWFGGLIRQNLQPCRFTLGSFEFLFFETKDFGEFADDGNERVSDVSSNTKEFLFSRFSG